MILFIKNTHTQINYKNKRNWACTYFINNLYDILPAKQSAHQIPALANVNNANADPCIIIEMTRECSNGSGFGADVYSIIFVNTLDAKTNKKYKKN